MFPYHLKILASYEKNKDQKKKNSSVPQQKTNKKGKTK